ncbi:MAG TPA: ABC transporter ATP-binding protein [Thermoplasmata archaeon]|nr:ABC transporter ATP-binding protein [Thermoplasmata archaeon]
MIHTDGLTKRFGDVVAVDHVSLDIAEGEVFGFLGPNGAGKTTTIRMLAGLIGRTEGSAEVAGCAIGRPADELRLRRQVGLLPENVGLYEGSSAYQNLEYFAELEGLDPPTRRRNIESLLRRMELWDRRDAPVGTFSKGMKQKVALARALVHDPPVLFLDEPTANLDPEASKMVRDLILGLKRERRTIFLNTHHLDEAQRICDRVGILRTRLLTVGSPEELRGRLWGGRTELRLERVTEPVLAAVRAAAGAAPVESTERTIVVAVADPDRDNPRLAEAAIGAGGRLQGLAQLTPSLEDVYLQLVGPGGGASSA